MLTSLSDLLPEIARREANDPERFPIESVGELYAAAVPQAPLPAALGGEGASCREATIALEAIATASPSLALIASIPLGLAGCMALQTGAPDEAWGRSWHDEVERIAADYRAGRIYAACNSEKGAGGSLAATKTLAAKDAGMPVAISFTTERDGRLPSGASPE